MRLYTRLYGARQQHVNRLIIIIITIISIIVSDNNLEEYHMKDSENKLSQASLSILLCLIFLSTHLIQLNPAGVQNMQDLH